LIDSAIGHVIGRGDSSILAIENGNIVETAQGKTLEKIIILPARKEEI
jgi:hypothetical protein